MWYSGRMETCYLIQVITGKETVFVKQAERLIRDAAFKFDDGPIDSDAADRHRFIIPRRELTIRRQGKYHKTVRPIFPGYVFWEILPADWTTAPAPAGSVDTPSPASPTPASGEKMESSVSETDDDQHHQHGPVHHEGSAHHEAPPAPEAELQAIRRILRRITGYIRFLKDHDGSLIPLKEQDLRLVHHLIAGGEIARASKVKFDVNNRIIALDGPLQGYEGSIIKVNRRKGRAKVQFLLHGKKFLIDFEFEALEHAGELEKEGDEKREGKKRKRK